MDPIALVAGGTLLVLGVLFALTLGYASERDDRSRPH